MKESIVLLLFIGVYIYVIKSKHIPSIIKNNVKSFGAQTVISILGFFIPWLMYGEVYENSSADIIYDIPTDGFYSELTKQAYICESISKVICMILYIIIGMTLIKQKSKLKDFLSVFIFYIILVIKSIVTSISMEDIYIWVPYLFISKSSHIALQKATPLIYNSVFFILLFVPTLLMWIGLQLKSVYNNRNKNIEE